MQLHEYDVVRSLAAKSAYSLRKHGWYVHWRTNKDKVTATLTTDAPEAVAYLTVSMARGVGTMPDACIPQK